MLNGAGTKKVISMKILDGAAIKRLLNWMSWAGLAQKSYCLLKMEIRACIWESPLT